MQAEFEDSVCVYGSGVLLKHLQALSQEVAGVQTGAGDIEFIHRMRVASRRLRSAFPLFAHCLPVKKQKIWLKEIKKVTQALGEARDSDVQIERLASFYKKIEDARQRPGVARLMLRLRQKRQGLQPAVSDAMDELQASNLIEAMTERLERLAARQEAIYLYTPALYRHAFGAISTRLDEFLSYDEIVTQPEKVQELHAMRISAKWLRYTLENLAPLYANQLKPYIQSARKAQEILGDIHDCDVWIAFVPQFLEEEKQRILAFYNHTRSFNRIEPGVACFLQDRQAAREKSYASFVQQWQKWKDDELWARLRQEIRAPFFQSAPQPAPPPEPAPQTAPAPEVSPSKTEAAEEAEE